ncbi:adhesion G protein-coupled receptor F5-like [Puntigrus tetrazona]|uniref:adhesion G protein-coupled receptor F5-like n=1 Tax=Puntigrus tetrazona TaxID=1606681 RepID=UPI001C89B165|nr:adhesion G protein-coupled receptor F5-like [Puntigrus tetrazona]
MASQDAGKVLKYCAGIILTVLLTHDCGVEALDFTETNVDLELRQLDGTTINAVTTAATVFTMSMTINEDFDISLNNPDDLKYKFYASKIQSAIEESYKNVPAYIKGSVRVIRFRPGSIIADYQFESTTSSPNSPDFANANKLVASTLIKQGFSVASDAFAQSEQRHLSAEEWYPQQNMVLKCVRPDSVEGTMRWTVNGQDPTLNPVKYSISSDSSTLTVNNVNELDRGRYVCIIDRTIPYIQWQDIVIQLLPNIIVGANDRTFQCVNQNVLLTCCEQTNSVEWTQISPDDVVTPPVDGCLTLNHAIKNGNCGSKTFICQLKSTALQSFSYGKKSVTVKAVDNVFSCKNIMLGDGIEGATVTGPCEKGKEGTITYRCRLGVWERQETNCILQVIVNLGKQVQVLQVQDIPVFMADLSTATQNNTQEITQSTVTVQTIVEILAKVAAVSQNVIINLPVMKNFLKTVDILVSTSSFSTWKKLNNNTRADNTSTVLLSAIENISARLTDANFTINEAYIDLSRIVSTSSSYIAISSLPHSNTEITIPQIPASTPITIIVFTTLDNVLPTRETSKKGIINPDVRINGDVVVVKVDNKTINNISFAFDITNQTLKNPQCVFWNFILDAWDSTGCEVKHFISGGIETGSVTCECNHTTSFSILMSPFAIDHQVLAYITYIGVAISMASLIICLTIETIVWKSMTRNDTSYMRHVSIVNIAVSLLIANICFIIGAAVAESEQPTSAGRCSPVVFFMQFFYLALFFWILLSALLLFYRTVMVLSQMSRAKMMVIAFTVGYGAPLLIAIITVASTAGPQNYVTKKDACWLNWNESKALLAFVIPALTIVAINLVVLIVVLYKMLRRGVGATTQPDEKHALVVIARCVAILTPIFGLTWGFGIGTTVSQELGVHVVFALLNSLQGFFILVFGTLLDSKIREALAGRLSLRNLTSSNRTRNTNVGPSSSSGQNFFLRNINECNSSRASIFTTTSSNSSYSSDTFMNA